MTTLRYVRETTVSLWSDTSAQGGSLLAIVDDALTGTTWNETVGGQNVSSRGSATLLLPFDSAYRDHAAIFNVVRFDEQWSDGTVRTWEYRITEAQDEQSLSANAAVLTITAAPIIEDYGRFQMRSVAGGVPTKRVTFTLLSPTAILTDVVLPALTDAGISGVSVGTVDAVGFFSYDERNVTPLALLTWLEGQTARECWLERTSETAWTLNVGTRGASASNPRAVVGENVTALGRTIIVDDNFANRVEPIGDVPPGETEPSTLAESLWDASATSGTGGRTVTLAAPDSSDPIITADAQLDGAEALTACDPLCPAQATAVGSLCFDTTRRYLWWITSGETLMGRDVESDTIVSLNLAQGGSVLAMGYDSSVDRLVIAYSNLATVLLVNPATPAIATTLSTTSNPQSLSVIPQLSKAYVGTTSSGTLIVNTSAGTIAAWTSGPGGGQIIKYLYHASSNRIVTYVPGATTLQIWAAPNGTPAVAGVTIGQAFVIAQDHTQTTMGVVASGALKWGTLTVSGTPSFSGFATMPAATGRNGNAFTLTPSDLLSAGGRYYIVGGRYVIGWDGSAYTGDAGDIGSANAYTLERGPTTSETSNLFVADLLDSVSAGFSRFALTTDCAPFEHWAVSNTNAANQTVDMPASGSGGPVRIATTSGYEARVQFRANSDLDYLTRLTDPDSVSTYGAVDASPSVAVLGLTNYWRGGTYDEWRSDDTNRWMAGTYNSGGPFATRFRGTEATPVSALACTFAATYTTPATSCQLAGLGAGRVLQPGDVINESSATSFLGGQFAFVTRRAVADGSGNATVSITPLGLNKTAGDSAWYTQPDLGTLPGGRTDCPVLYGTTSPWIMRAPVPVITGDSTAWVVAHLKIACYGGTPNTVKLTARDPFASSDHSDVVPAQTGDSSAISTGAVIDRWLAQRIDLSTAPGHGLVRFKLTIGSALAVYPVSCAVMLSASSTVDTTNQTGVTDLFDSEGPRAIWRLATLRLAQGNMPTAQYTLTPREDDPATPFVVGASVTLIDPTRGISSTPRITSVTRHLSWPDMPIKLPELELSTATTSFLREFADLQTTVNLLMQNAA